MVEFTEDEEKRYQERVKFREDKARREAEQAAKVAVEPSKKKGILERVADRAESARGKYDYGAKQIGRIGKAITPAKKPAAQRSVRVIRQPLGRAPKRGRARYPVQTRYVKPSMLKPSYDPLNDLIHGSQSGTGARRTSDHINDLTGASPGRSSAFFDDIMGHSGKKKRGGRDPFKDLLG